MKRIKLFDPISGIEEEKAVIKTLRSNFWASGAGTGNVLQFEAKFNKYVESKHCVAVNNGTAALHLALSLADIKNKEVILPSMSFVSTAHAVLYNGGIPVIADIDPQSLCIDTNSIKKLITKRTKVILPVHFAGMSANLDEISSICKEHRLLLIEDAAHAAGSTYKNKRIGSHGNAVCFSFHPVKNLAMPTGGAITLNGKKTDSSYEKLKIRRWCGISNRIGALYDVNELGWNFYMNEFSAAIGLVQLKKLDKLNKIRKSIAKKYFQQINLEEKMPYDENCSYHFYWIKVKNRNNFMKMMSNNNIETGIHYKPIHKMKLYDSRIKLPNSEYAGEHIVSLPTSPNLTDSDVSKIIHYVNTFD